MKKPYTLILTLLITSLAFGSGGVDSLSTKSKAPKTRSFAVEPVAAKNVVEIPNERVFKAPKVIKNRVNLQSRSFSALDAKIDEKFFQQFQTQGEFTETFIATNYPVNPAVNEHLAKAIHTFNKINEKGNFVDTISPDNLIELPVGLKKTINNVTYMVGISTVKLLPDSTVLTVYVRIILPQLDMEGKQKQLFFGAPDIPLSHDGGIDNETNLVLLGDFTFPISGGNGLVKLKGGFNMESGAIENKSYVTIDCDGFKELRLEAEVQFSRKILEPLKEDYKVDNSKPYGAPHQDDKIRVAGQFGLTVQDWNNILIGVTLPRFQMTSFKGMAFEVNNAVFDFSDTRNSETMVFPPNYQQYLIEGSEETWRGVYLKSVEVILPKVFQRRDSTKRVTIGAADMLVDGVGLTGKFNAQNVLPLDKGIADKWQFSVDSIGIDIVANSLVGAGFKGKLVLPITKEVLKEDNQFHEKDDLLSISYTGIINPPNEYILSASGDTEVNFDIWKARATLTPDSYVEIAVKDGKFRPKAVLHGSMYIKASKQAADIANQQNAQIAAAEAAAAEAAANTSEDTEEEEEEVKLIDFPKVTFQDLQLQTEMPVLNVKYLGYSGEVRMANFPVTLSDIELRATPTAATLSFDVAVHLMKDRFKGETGLGIKGEFTEEEGLQKWKFQRLVIDEIKVDADLGGVAFKGSINIMDGDPVYGDGFKGSVSAKFKGLGNVGISSNAIFGKTEFRYWYIDGLVDNLNIQTGTPFKIKGFGGGAYYKMKRAGFSSTYNSTGSDYLPDVNSGLGVKAMLLYANAVSSRVFNGGAGFEIAFNATGGINRIALYGEGHFMKDFDFKNPAAKINKYLKHIETVEASISPEVLEQLKQSDPLEVSKTVYPDERIIGKTGIQGFAAIEYDFTRSTLHGTLDIYVDVIGGLFKGRASGNRAGWAVMHFGPEAWYIHMGTPTDRLGLKFGIGSLSLEIGGYFMIGDQIPGSPPPPPIVAQILGTDAATLDYMRDENALGDGRGFAFGADFSVDTGDISFLIFYARFQAGIGMDIMIKDYGEAACKGSGQVGINGWYTNGQSYAYLQGELGIRVKLLFIKKRITILSAGAAVLLQTKLPNPAWFRGYLGGHFNILGGLIKGRFRLKIELGEECEFINAAPLDGLKIIADISPNNNSSNVDVFSVPQVGFNMKIGEPFEFEDDEGIATYRINLEEFKVSERGTEIIGKINWNTNKDVLSFTPSEILPPEKQLDLTVSVSFEQRKNGNWVVMKEDGQPAIETEERTFTTGKAPDHIPLTNIAYCYPTIDQKYVYKNEYNTTYVKLKIGQSYLFNSEAGFSYKAFFETVTSSAKTTLNYDVADKRVYALIPELSASEEYMLRFESQTSDSQDSEYREDYVAQDVGQGNELEVKNVSIEGTATNALVTELLHYDFKTSQYNTFQEKMNAKNLTLPIVDIVYSDVHSLEAGINTTEPFDIVELDGNQYTGGKSLVKVEAVLDDSYFVNEIKPLVYNGYPLENRFTVDRDPNILGVPPTKGIEKLTWYQTYLESNPTDPLLSKRLPFRYYQAFYYKTDFIDIQYKIVNTYLQNPALYPGQIATYNYIINGNFPYLKPGNYKSNVSYMLPGEIAGSSKIFTFNRPN